MGPRFLRTRKVGELDGIRYVETTLQWGRALVNAEGIKAQDVNDWKNDKLQRDRVLLNAEGSPSLTGSAFRDSLHRGRVLTNAEGCYKMRSSGT